MMNTVNTEFSHIEVWLTNQSNKALQIEDDINLILIIGQSLRTCLKDTSCKQYIKMKYSSDPRFRKYVKGYGFFSFAKKFGNKYGKKLMDTATKTGMDAAKIASKRAVQKTAEATGDLIGNKIADKITSIGKPKEKKKNKRNRRNLHFTRKKTRNY